MMTIGIVVDNEYFGDPRVNNEVKILKEAGYAPVVLCFNHGSYPEYSEKDGVRIIRVTIPKKLKNLLFTAILVVPFYNWLWQKRIKQLVRDYSIDILHVHDLYMSKPAAKAIRNLRIPYILDLHENYPVAIRSFNWANKFPAYLITRPNQWKKLERSYLTWPDQIIVLSDDFSMALEKEYPFLKGKMNVYPNVPDLQEFDGYTVDPEILPKHNSFILFYFGAIAERRGIFTAFDALRLLLDQGLDVSLLAIGPVDKADVPRFDHYRTDEKLKDHVIFYPWKDISLIPSYIVASDACLSPLIRDDQHESGVANKVFQYMLYERPIVVSDCRPQARVALENECGLVFRSGDAADLAEKIAGLTRNRDQGRQMGQNGRKAVLEKYNMQVYNRKLIGLYQKIAERK